MRRQISTLEPVLACHRVARTLAISLCAAAGVLLVAHAPRASATPSPVPAVRTIQDVAGQSPFAGLDCNTTNGQMQAGGREGEPMIAVNPRNPENEIAAWMDRTRNTVDTSYTMDGGRTWHKSVPMGIDACTGNVEHGWEGNADVWVSFSPNGEAYFTSIPWNNAFTPPFSAWLEVGFVQTSSDGGATWSAPLSFPNPLKADDKPMTLVDRFHPNTVYMVDANEDEGTPIGNRGATKLLFYRSTNGGRSFDIRGATLAGTPTVHDWIWNSQLAELRSGALVVTYPTPEPAGQSGWLMTRRSDNQGLSWSTPVKIRYNLADPQIAVCGADIAGAPPFTSQSGQTAVVNGRDLAVAVVRNSPTPTGRSRIYLSVSRNGGRSWQTHVAVSSPWPVFMASVVGDNRGHLGLVYDQARTRQARCGTSVIPARTRFALSADLGRRWKTTTVGPRWWNLGSAAKNSVTGWWLGDFQSLAATPSGFTTITVQGHALAGRAVPMAGATGVMVATLAVP